MTVEATSVGGNLSTRAAQRESRARDAVPAHTLVDLFERSYTDLVRLAVLLVDTDEAAEDCVQDAFVRVHRRWQHIDDPDAYLRTAVVNACRDQLRRRRVRRAFRPDPKPPDTIPEADDELAQLLGRLSRRRRTAIVLRFYADMADEDIADHLGCRPATVRSLIHRGLEQLREVMNR